MCRREDRDGKEERVSMQRDLSTSNWELIAKSYGHGISKRHGSQQHKKGDLDRVLNEMDARGSLGSR